MIDKERLIEDAIKLAFEEDLGDGDHSSLACIDYSEISKAVLLVKEEGVLAGVEIAKKVFDTFGEFEFEFFLKDGDLVKPGDKAFTVKGSAIGILSCERLALNIMQRMSGIATRTASLIKLIGGTKTKLLDTRKTTPNFRVFEKEAVLIGGGFNHRFALYDMIMLKDNHIDYAGGIKEALLKTKKYLSERSKDLRVEIEVRDLKELEEALSVGNFNRVMFDNFTPMETVKALQMVAGEYETESSGNINEKTIKDYALTGVDFISVGALTNQVKSLDLSLKAF